MTKYTLLREDGYYPDGTYRNTLAWKGLIASNLESARLWSHRKAAEKYVGTFGGKVIEVKVTIERIS